MRKYITYRKNSRYSILLPQNSSEVLKFAGKELTYFISLVSGTELETVSVFDEEQKYISIGNTPVYKRYQNLMRNGENNASAYSVKTIEGHVIISGNTDNASLYGVYGFLNKLLGVEIYSGDSFKIPNQENIPFEELDFCDSADIEHRFIGFYNVLEAEPENTYRMRAIREAYYSIWGGLWAHTMLSDILPVKKDAGGEVIHNDWYNKTQTQLCFTNTEAQKQFIINLKEKILLYPNAPLFMLGTMDNDEYCDCPDCRASDEKYGGASGTHIRFINSVAREINTWQKEVLPESNFKLVAFAYNAVKKAPVIYDNSIDKYVPVDPSVVMENNTAIMVAPLDACALHSFNAPCNRSVYERLLGWSEICKTVLIWDYHAYFDNYFIYMPSIKAYKDNIALYKKIGASFVYNEGLLMGMSPGFHDLKIYLLSKLMWDSSADADRLTNDFIKNYYRSAAGHIKRFLTKLESNYTRLERVYENLGERGYHTAFQADWQPDVLTERHWPREFVFSLEELLEDALIKVRATEKGEALKKVEIRVKTELLMIKYLILELHTYYCGEEEFNNRICEFQTMAEECGIKRLTHWGWSKAQEKPHMFIASRIATWRNRYPNRVKHNQ